MFKSVRSSVKSVLNSVRNLSFSFETTSLTRVAMSDLLRGGWLGPGALFNASMVSARALFTSVNPSFFKMASSGFAIPSRELGWGWNVTHLFRSLNDL